LRTGEKEGLSLAAIPLSSLRLRSAPMASMDAVIVGGGHNGLVAAAYLAKAGLRVLVLERRSIVGGACVTEEIHPGFRASTLADLASVVRTPEAEDFLRRIIFTSSADMLDEFFESDEVKASLATSAVAGTMAGPRTPGTAFVLGHHTLGNIGGVNGVWGWSR